MNKPIMWLAPAVSLCAAWPLQAQELDPALNRSETVVRAAAAQPEQGWSVAARGAVSVGTAIRNSAQKSTLRAGGATNSDDGNLNYLNGDTFSRVVQGVLALDLKHSGGYGVAASAHAWYDDNLLHHAVPQGNNPNNYLPGPLSDHGFDPEARFDGIALLNAYAYGSHQGGAGTLAWRLGRMQLERMTEFGFSGGLRDLEVRNVPGSTRPGALREEGIIPVWAATARLDLNPAWRVEGFWQLAPEHSVANGCGTFLSSTDYSQPGCERVFYSSKLTQAQNTARGIYFSRGEDVTPAARPDQFGVSTTYQAAAINTRVTAFYAHYDSRDGYTSSLKGTGLGPASGGRYAIEYPGDKNLLALSTTTRFAPANVTWTNEASVTGRQPVQLNTSDLLAAGLGAGGVLGPQLAAAPNHSLFHGYRRFTVSQWQSGVRKTFDRLTASTSAFIEAEASVKHVNGLPDVSLLHFGRPEVSDACDVPADCAGNIGYVTPTAWSYRLRAGAEWRDPLPGILKLQPSVLFGHDVHGWSYDYAFVQDRKTLRVALDATFAGGVFASASVINTWDGQFNSRRDRDYLTFSVGKRF
ncbi:MAG: DUF1302 family protein [Pseudomonadota bacterium]